MKGVCTRLAEAGFVAFAPDLYHSKVADTIAGSVVLFYGTGGDEFGRSKATYLAHFAENDPFEPQASVDELEQALKQAGRPVMFYRYSGTGHWFFEPDRTDAYNREAATLAWERTLTFLKQ
jgi:carboxymethylenebutenolidase